MDSWKLDYIVKVDAACPKSWSFNIFSIRQFERLVARTGTGQTTRF